MNSYEALAASYDELTEDVEYEKRADESKKEWKREQERIMKKDSKGRNVY